jgi:hypothetical protein
MRRLILPSVVCVALPYFPTLSHKQHDFLFKKRRYWIQNFVLIFSANSFGTFLTLCGQQPDVITNVCRSSCTVYVILVRCYWNLCFLYWFSKNIQVTNFMKNGRADGHEANSHLSKFLRILKTVFQLQRPTVSAVEERNRLPCEPFQKRQTVPAQRRDFNVRARGKIRQPLCCKQLHPGLALRSFVIRLFSFNNLCKFTLLLYLRFLILG